MNEQFDRATVGEIVAADFRTAAVFERYGIDFCCGGRVPLPDACAAARADLGAVVDALSAFGNAGAGDDDVTAWPVSRLVEHILATHHAYVKRTLPVLDSYLRKLQQVHGARHPELGVVASQFEAVAAGLSQHMFKEEHVLFPYIMQLGACEAAGRSLGPSPFGTVRNPIQMMEREHQEAGDEMRAIREATGGYSVPSDGCATFSACYQELQAFERDLHRHVHLENNVLFPASVELEQRLTART